MFIQFRLFVHAVISWIIYISFTVISFPYITFEFFVEKIVWIYSFLNKTNSLIFEAITEFRRGKLRYNR